jgi:hypothetical protein
MVLIERLCRAQIVPMDPPAGVDSIPE